MKNLLFICFIVAALPFGLSGQSDDILNYTHLNKPAESTSKYKKYNELAQQYNYERQRVKESRKKFFLITAGTLVGAFLVAPLVFPKDKNIEYYTLIVASPFLGTTGKRNGKYALSDYQKAQKEMRELGIK